MVGDPTLTAQELETLEAFTFGTGHPTEEELDALANGWNRLRYGIPTPQPGPPPLPPMPNPLPPQGIYPNPTLTRRGIEFVNGWRGRMRHTDYAALAGFYEGTQQGLVLVERLDPKTYAIDFQEYPTPREVGVVRIISASKDGVLTLRAPGRHPFIFNVRAGDYVSG